MHNGMRPIHPGEVLREEFNVRSVSGNAGCIPWVRDFIAERVAVDVDKARLLRCITGASEDFWLNLQASYDAAKGRR